MAREIHYKYFKELYDEEAKRAAELHDGAKVNTSLVALYGAFITLLVTAPDKTHSSQTVSFEGFLFCLAIGALFLSLFLSLYASRIFKYQVPNYPDDVLAMLPDYDDDDLFYEDRIIDLTAAYNWNSEINDRKVTLLTFARYLLLAGIAIHFMYCIIRVV